VVVLIYIAHKAQIKVLDDIENQIYLAIISQHNLK